MAPTILLCPSGAAQCLCNAAGSSRSWEQKKRVSARVWTRASLDSSRRGITRNSSVPMYSIEAAFESRRANVRSLAGFGPPRQVFTAALESNIVVEEPPILAEASKENSEEQSLESISAVQESEQSSSSAAKPLLSKKIKRFSRGREEPTVKEEELVPGAAFTGKVTTLQRFGAFVNFGAFTDGLVHISKLSPGFVSAVEDIVSVGQEVKVTVLDVNMENRRIALSMVEDAKGALKPAQSNSGTSRWQEGTAGRPVNKGSIAGRGRPGKRDEGSKPPSKLQKGQEVKGTVKNVVRSGVFVELPDGEEGFLKLSERPGGENMAPEASLQSGQSITTTVLRIDRGKIYLTMKPVVDMKSINQAINKGQERVATNPFQIAFRQLNIISDAVVNHSQRGLEEPLTEIESAAPVTEALSSISKDEDTGSEEPEEEPQTQADITPAPEVATNESQGHTLAQLVEVDSKPHGEQSDQDQELLSAFLTAEGEVSDVQEDESKDLAAELVPSPDSKQADQDVVETIASVDFPHLAGGSEGDEFSDEHGTAVSEHNVEQTEQKGEHKDLGPDVEADIPASTVHEDEKRSLAESDASPVVEQPGLEPVLAQLVVGVEISTSTEAGGADPKAELAASDSDTEGGKLSIVIPTSMEAGITGPDAGSDPDTEGEQPSLDAVAAQLAAGTDIPVSTEAGRADSDGEMAPVHAGQENLNHDQEDLKDVTANTEFTSKSSASVSAAVVKELRDETGAGMMDCKRALGEAGGEIEKAREILRRKGLASADKKASRIAAEGLVGSYIHDSRIGVLIEVNCETDFVSRGPTFIQLVEDLAMQVAASPQVQFVSVDDVPADMVQKERELEFQREDLGNKPEAIRARIVDGRIAKRLAELSLLEQPFIKDDSFLVKDLVKQTVAVLGENIQVRRFERYSLGEGLQKSNQDITGVASTVKENKGLVTDQDLGSPDQNVETKLASEASTRTAESGVQSSIEMKSESSARSVSAAVVKELRDETGAGMMNCKKALTESGGEMEKAREILRKKGLASADKKSSRVAAEGLVGSYIHDSRIGVLIEVNCETDFVSRGPTYKQLVEDLAMQVVASPQVQFVSVDDVPADLVQKERELEFQREDLGNKPEAIRGRIVDGRITKRLAELALLEQPFIRDDSILIKDLVKQTVAVLGENIQVRRFERYTLGEGLKKRS